MRKLKILILLILALILTGCGKDTAQTTSTSLPVDSRYKQMTGKVVVFGTSIWAIERGPTGVASRLEEMTSFKVTDNSLLGGMAVRLEDDIQTEVSLVSILFYDDNKYNKKLRESIKDADYVILAFGGNDQYRGVPASGDGNSFENALSRSVTFIKEMNPNVRIVLIAPLNGWTLEDGEYIAFADIDNGGGKLGDYIDATERVAQKNNLLCVKMSEAIVFSKDEPYKYFKDGSHLTELGSILYAQYLTEKIYGFYYSK